MINIRCAQSYVCIASELVASEMQMPASELSLSADWRQIQTELIIEYFNSQSFTIMQLSISSFTGPIKLNK